MMVILEKQKMRYIIFTNILRKIERGEIISTIFLRKKKQKILGY